MWEYSENVKDFSVDDKSESLKYTRLNEKETESDSSLSNGLLEAIFQKQNEEKAQEEIKVTKKERKEKKMQKRAKLNWDTKYQLN